MNFWEKMMSERQFQKWFLQKWADAGRWGMSLHPSFGSKTGEPDVMLLNGGVLLPIELKTAKIDAKGLILDSEARASQIRWLGQFAKFGGLSTFCAGIENGRGWDIYEFNGQSSSGSTKRFDLSEILAHSSVVEFGDALLERWQQNRAG